MDPFCLRDVGFKMLVRDANVGIREATENGPLVSRGEVWAADTDSESSGAWSIEIQMTGGDAPGTVELETLAQRLPLWTLRALKSGSSLASLGPGCAPVPRTVLGIQ